MEISVLIEKAQAGDASARKILIEENLGLVHHIVKRFAGRGYEVEDLFQTGTIGLMKAIDHFDLSYDVKFSTYAVPLIAGEIRRFLRDDGPDIGAVDHVSARKKININGQYRKNCRLYQLGPIVKSTYAYINAIRIR